MNQYARVLVEAAQVHADTVLQHAKDRWGRPTPLLADGLCIENYQPVIWHQDGRQWVLSNPASQQNFLRLLIGLEKLGGVQQYGDTARRITDYILHHMRIGDLIWWGGHCAADLQHHKLIFCNHGSPYPRHELERCFPFYGLMYDTHPGRAVDAMEGFWDLHVDDWQSLSFNRHNVSTLPSGAGSIWDRDYTGGPVVSRYFTFLPAGIDLAHAATQLSILTGDRRPLLWARRLVSRYVEAGNSSTGLLAYLYNATHAHDRDDGRSNRVDRANLQLGEVLGREVEERSVWTGSQQRDGLYCFIALLEMSQATGDEYFGDVAVAGLRAFANHTLDATTGIFHPALTDGTKLSGLALSSDGYFGAKGSTLQGVSADMAALLAFSLAYRHSGDADIWRVCRLLGGRLKLGDFGEPDAASTHLARRTSTSDPLVLLAMIALFQATKRLAFLGLANQIAEKMMTMRLQNGLFAPPGRRYARIDALEPLALLHLAQIHDGVGAQVPTWFGGSGRFHAAYDGHGRTTDAKLFYS